MNPVKVSSQILFWICFVLGLALRLYALGTKPFWFDESITYYFAHLPIKSLLEAVASDNNPPLYYLLIHFLQKLSASEYILRLPSLLVGIVTIFASLKLAKILKIKDHYFAASLMSLSPLTIYLSWEARLHSLGTMLAVFLVISFFILQKNFSLKNFLIFLAVAAISFHTQYYLLLLLVPLMLITTTTHKQNFANWLKVVATSLLLLVPWIMYSQNFTHNSCLCPNTLISLPATLTSPIVAGVGQITQRSFLNLPLSIMILFVASTLIFFYYFLKGATKDLKATSLYFIPFMLVALPGLFWEVFSPKGFSIFVTFFFLILSQSNPKLKMKFLLLTLLATISVIQLFHPFFKEDNLKNLSHELSKYDLPIFHSSIITYYPMEFYNPNQNFMFLENPLNEHTFALIGGQPITNPQINKFLLVYSKIFTSHQTFLTLENNFSKTQILKNENFFVFEVTKK